MWHVREFFRVRCTVREVRGNPGNRAQGGSGSGPAQKARNPAVLQVIVIAICAVIVIARSTVFAPQQAVIDPQLQALEFNLISLAECKVGRQRTRRSNCQIDHKEGPGFGPRLLAAEHVGQNTKELINKSAVKPLAVPLANTPWTNSSTSNPSAMKKLPKNK